MFRSFVAVIALAVAPVAARAADEENPYKNAKVGDYATYTMTTKVATIAINGSITQTVTEKTDKEATIKVTGTIEFGGNKMDIPAHEQKIDLTMPFDPTKGANLPGGADAKIEKGKEGKEKIKVNGKEYDATWTEYKVKAKVMNQEVDAQVKAWMAKEVPAGMVKMTMTADIAGQKMEMVMELKETGSKKSK
ncbi:MAG: hypothetical protein FJ304_25090 [Planctomycetes bacterium]|nr:hypothetical protein [Planctomycetota bacterium]